MRNNKEANIWKGIEVLIWIATICLTLYMPYQLCNKQAQIFNKYSNSIKIDAWDVLFGNFVIPADTKGK